MIASEESAVPRPLCTCHGFGACVHRDNYRPDPHGRDPKRGWNWHCAAEDCSGYSRVLIVLEEWVSDEAL